MGIDLVSVILQPVVPINRAITQNTFASLFKLNSSQKTHSIFRIQNGLCIINKYK